MKAKNIGLTLTVLAVAITPVAASAVIDTQANTVSATVGSMIDVSASNPTAISATPGAAAVYSNTSHVVTVATNNATGYDLTLNDTDTVTNLVHTDTTTTIAASANTTASPAVLVSNTWGFAVGGLGTFDATYSGATDASAAGATKWAGVPSSASPFNIKTSSATASADTVTVWYGLEVDATKKSGSYTDSVTYTGTTKP